MSAATLARAPSAVTWDGINWAKVQRHVRGLQTRIVKATQGGRHNQVKALQWLLTHSFSGKALAVKCWVPSDHVPVRSWPLFRARQLMRDVIESFKQDQAL